MALKTLLVGLGGTGCEIAARVKKKIGSKDGNVQYVGFDTDGTWEGTDGLPIVYTSRESTVRQYLMGFPGWEEWFPDNAQIMARSMVKGAGQVRALSRLALADTLNAGRIGILDNAIRSLRISDGDVTPQNLRVMIVSSFAGGTGSGMFIQMALFIRAYIRKHYHGEVIIRGLFALPDLFKEKMESDDQTISIYANAYASLKELNAINTICLSTDIAADKIHMKIDNLFDSKKDRGHAEKKPYDFIFFVDDVNANGRVLQSLEDYKELMTTATIMQVYSPVTPMGDSREDNIILAIIGGNGKPLYGSVGASKIVYPYEDIARYCGLRMTVESISEVWGLIDREYKQAEAENKQQRAIDITVKPLVKSEYFISKVNSLIDEGNTRFNFINEAMTAKDDSDKTIDRVDDYYDKVLSFVITKIKQDSEVLSHANSVGVTEKQLKNNLVNAVARNETALKDYQNTIDERIRLLRTPTVRSVVPEKLHSALNTRNEWNIEELLTKNNHVVHPLAVRMLLYRLRDALKSQQESASADTASQLKKINEYFKKAYDIVGTDAVETANDRASNKGFFARKSFSAEYLVKSAAQKSRLDKYCESKFINVVFSDIIQSIDALIEQYENMFNNLGAITAALNDEINVLENVKHSNIANTTTYVCASAKEKRDIYDSLGMNFNDNNDNEVYGVIFDTLYEAGQNDLKARLEKKSNKSFGGKNGVNMIELFINSIVMSNIEELKSAHATELDINVYDALTRGQANGGATADSLIRSAFDKAVPYLLHSITRPIESVDAQNADTRNSAYTMTFWGVNPEVYDSIDRHTGTNAPGSFFTAGNGTTVPEVVSNDEYSRYEISCYEALYCVTLEEIPKFVETGDSFGVFYENYSKRVNRLRAGDKGVICPHIDLNWHKREYLPMISDSKNLEDDRRAARAMWLALIYGGLPEETVEGVKAVYACFADESGKEKYPSVDLKFNGKRIRITHTFEIFKALQFDTATSDRLLEVYEAFYAKEKEARENLEIKGPRAARFAKKLVSADNSDRNALNIIARFVSDSGMTDYERGIFTDVLTSLIDDYFDGYSESKKKDFRKLIYSASRFGGKNASRSKYERLINFGYWNNEND